MDSDATALPTFRGNAVPNQHEEHLAGRAFELAASVDRALERHLEECTARYMAVQEKLEDINKLFIKVAGAIIMLLLSIMGWLLTH